VIGTYQAKAQYSGDSHYAGGSASDQVVVAKANPTMSLSNTTTVWSTFGNTVTFTAVLSGIPGGAVPSGTVSWSLSGTATFDRCTSPSALTNYGTVATATCTVVLLNAGTISVTATYSGDGNYNAASKSESISVARGQAPQAI
jgi:hypothetical protein